MPRDWLDIQNGSDQEKQVKVHVANDKYTKYVAEKLFFMRIWMKSGVLTVKMLTIHNTEPLKLKF